MLQHFSIKRAKENKNMNLNGAQENKKKFYR